MNRDQYEIYHEKKKHTSEEFPYNTYLCSIPLDFSAVNLHWHEEMEIIVIKKGCGMVSVDLVSYFVQEGDMVFVAPGQLHSIAQKEQEKMEYENILFKPGLLKSAGYDMCYDTFLSPFFEGKIGVYPVCRKGRKDYQETAKMIQRIDDLCDKKPYGYQVAVKGHLFCLLFTLISNGQKKEKKNASQKSLEKTKAILSYVAENFQREITIEEIANHCYYSKSYFMKFFKETMGSSFIQYLNEYRLDRAAKLLTTTTENVYEVAMEVGFENLSYFNRCFKKKYGMTPGQYRKRLGFQENER